MLTVETYTNENGSNMYTDSYNDVENEITMDDIARDLMKRNDWDYAYVWEESHYEDICTIYRNGDAYEIEYA